MTAFDSRPFRFRSEAPEQVPRHDEPRLALPCPVGRCGTYVFGATAEQAAERLARHARSAHARLR
jgi:hypothetical protein